MSRARLRGFLRVLCERIFQISSQVPSKISELWLDFSFFHKQL